MTLKPWGLNHTFIFFCWAGLSREARLCSMWHHSTQFNCLYFREGASQSCKLVLHIGSPLCGHPYPVAWASSQNGTGNQPTNLVFQEVGNKIHQFLETQIRKLDSQSPAHFCPSSPDLSAKREPRNFGNTLPSFHSHLFVISFIRSLIYS